MKVLLINPPITKHSSDVSPISKGMLIGLAYIAANLRRKGHIVKILDCLTNSFDYSELWNFRYYGLSEFEIRQEMIKFAPDLIGISCMFTAYAHDAHKVARIAKQWDKAVPVVFGGSHATAFPECVAKDPNVDRVVVGEGEFSLLQIIEQRVKSRIVKAPPLGDLDSLPFPAWDLLEKDLAVVQQERKLSPYFMRHPVINILSSRGCPNQCYFCSVHLSQGRKWRARSALDVSLEILELYNKGYREIHFVDDNATIDKQRMTEICERILASGVKLRFALPTGVALNTLDKAVLKVMRRAGFYRLCFGVEVGDQSAQKTIGKNVDLAKAMETIKTANRLGFWTSATFIIGFPYERQADIDKTLSFAIKSGIDFPVIYLLTPQPKTAVYEQMGIDLSRYMEYNSPEWYKIGLFYMTGQDTQHFTKQQLRDNLDMMYKKFLWAKAINPKTYIGFLSKLRSFEDIAYASRIIGMPLKMAVKTMLGKRLSNIDTTIKRR